MAREQSSVALAARRGVEVHFELINLEWAITWALSTPSLELPCMVVTMILYPLDVEVIYAVHTSSYCIKFSLN